MCLQSVLNSPVTRATISEISLTKQILAYETSKMEMFHNLFDSILPENQSVNVPTSIEEEPPGSPTQTGEGRKRRLNDAFPDNCDFADGQHLGVKVSEKFSSVNLFSAISSTNFFYIF